MEVSGENVEDCELSDIFGAIQINPSRSLPSKAIDFLNKLAYFDLSDGIPQELCISIISKWCGQNDRDSESIREKEAHVVLHILRDSNVISEMKKTKNLDDKFFQMQSHLQNKILAQNESNLSFITDLANVLKDIWLDMCGAFIYKSSIFHIHRCLKRLGWPGDTIKLSMCLAVSSLQYDEKEPILDDIKGFLSTSNRNSIDWITCQMVQIYKDTLTKSRKVLQPLDTISIDLDDGTQEIRLDNYGSWILNQIRIYSNYGADCDALISVAVISLERLQKHARFCNKPDELSLNWILEYTGREWYNLNCFAALACHGSTDEWLSILCRAYIQKLGKRVECCEKSEFLLNDSYRSWVCLRDLVKASRVQHEFITALCDENGLQFLNMNFSKCETTLANKEYCLKYQAQTVIEMLKPLIVIGRSELVAKLFEMQSFWNFTILVLQKHPFISERYNLSLENDLLCACEVYLDLLVAVCNRKEDAIDNKFLISFLMENYLQTYTSVIRSAREIDERRQRHTCIYYLFTVLFTLFALLRSNELVDVYVSNADIRKVIDEYSDGEGTAFEVANGCLREYRKYIEAFCELYSHDSKFADVIRLTRKMFMVPTKYDWESDKD